jgi:hypothetical protein
VEKMMKNPRLRSELLESDRFCSIEDDEEGFLPSKGEHIGG